MEITLILTSAVGEASNVTYPMTLKKTNKTKKKASYIIKHGWTTMRPKQSFIPSGATPAGEFAGENSSNKWKDGVTALVS